VCSSDLCAVVPLGAAPHGGKHRALQLRCQRWPQSSCLAADGGGGCRASGGRHAGSASRAAGGPWAALLLPQRLLEGLPRRGARTRFKCGRACRGQLECSGMQQASQGSSATSRAGQAPLPRAHLRGHSPLRGATHPVLLDVPQLHNAEGCLGGHRIPAAAAAAAAQRAPMQRRSDRRTAGPAI